MFKKVLKYDMRAVSKLWWIGAVVSVGASLVGALLIRFFTQMMDAENDRVFLQLISIFGLIAACFCVAAVFLAPVFTMVLVFVRFYKNFFTDEGYLTFTLPVKRSTLFFSKTVNAAIWLAAHLAVIVLSMLGFVVLVVPPEAGQGFFHFIALQTLGTLFSDAWQAVEGWLIVYLFEALLGAFAYLMFMISVIHFCITFGSVLVKKAKLILSIGLYYAISSGIAIAVQFASLFFGALMSDGMRILMENATKNISCAVYAFLVLAIVAAVAALATVFYSVTQFLLDRKLNLA